MSQKILVQNNLEPNVCCTLVAGEQQLRWTVAICFQVTSRPKVFRANIVKESKTKVYTSLHLNEGGGQEIIISIKQ
jgi:hypothetical protein